MGGEGCECEKVLSRPLAEEKVRQQSNLAVRATAGGFSSSRAGLAISCCLGDSGRQSSVKPKPAPRAPENCLLHDLPAA